MNDPYDDSEDYSSSNSFRARSNTWPLNRPDLVVPNGVCIDETLPEIDLEEDDLFTTNENWSTTGLVDHDIMSWDPILNAQQPHQHNTLQTQPPPQAQQQTTNNQHLQHTSNATTTSTTNHNNNVTNNNSTYNRHHEQQLQQQPHHSIAVNSRPQQSTHQHQPTTVHHHHHQPQQQLIQQQQQPPPPPPPLQHNLHQQLTETSHQAATAIHHQHAPHHHHNQQHHHDNLLDNSNLIVGPAQVHQQQQPITPQHHQTLNSSSHCLDSDNYHIQQMHQLRLDNPPHSDLQSHYVSPLSSGCLHNPSTQLACETYNIGSLDQPNHHHLQPLMSARYDLDHTNDLDMKSGIQNHHLHHHHNQHQLHQMSASLDHGSNILSSSLGTSGIGLSSDLENLDYKVVDPSAILPSDQLDEQQQIKQHHLQHQQRPSASDSGGSGAKLSNSTASSKTKLNTPRRNAWGNMSYADLISQAINSTSDKRLTLSQIYEWMVQHVPYFKDKGDSNSSAGWKNSVRHNLSLHNRFKRLQNEGTGKSSWWTINPEANIGKCARRRAASMEAPKYEKKRGRAKKRAEAIRQGLLSYPSLSNSSLNGSTSALEQQLDHPSPDRFGSNQQLNQQQPTGQILTQPQDSQLHQPAQPLPPPPPPIIQSQPLRQQQPPPPPPPQQQQPPQQHQQLQQQLQQHQIHHHHHQPQHQQQQHQHQYQHQQEQQQQQHQNSDQHHSSLKLSRNNVLDLIPFPIS